MSAVRLIMMLPRGDDTNDYFSLTLPHLIMVIIDTISLLYQVFTTAYQDNWSLLQDCQVYSGTNKLWITVQERNAQFVNNSELVLNQFGVFMFTLYFFFLSEHRHVCTYTQGYIRTHTQTSVDSVKMRLYMWYIVFLPASVLVYLGKSHGDEA